MKIRTLNNIQVCRIKPDIVPYHDSNWDLRYRDTRKTCFYLRFPNIGSDTRDFPTFKEAVEEAGRNTRFLINPPKISREEIIKELEDAIDNLDSECTCSFCEGNDMPFKPMHTCRVCYPTQNLMVLLAKIKGGIKIEG